MERGQYVPDYPVMIQTLWSCEINKLNEDSIDWQPYKERDVLIFKSSKGQTDTVWIKTIKIRNADANPEYFDFKRFETLSVEGEISLNPPFQNSNKSVFYKTHISLIYLNAGDPDYISFEFSERLNKDYFYPTIRMNIEDLKKMNENVQQFNFNSIKVIIEDPKILYSNSKDDISQLEAFLWSKTYGYTRFEFSDGSFKELIKFIRNDVNILTN